jgi:diguanylate cyclase (GGDEF)-like protein
MAYPLPILHVEDDPLDSLLLQEMLCSSSASPCEYDITQVTSLRDALCKLKSDGFSAVLLDLSLEDASGVDNVRAIREQNPEVPIVVLTGFDCNIAAGKALSEGAQEYIVKSYSNSKTVHLAIQSSIANKAAERHLYEQAYHDDLTGLPNSRMFNEELVKAMKRADNWHRHETVIMLDLDDFSEINQKYGLEAGNEVLKDVANRLKVTLAEDDVICRYESDRFVVLLSDRRDDKKYSCVKTLANLQAAFNKPFYWRDDIIKFTASMGVAFYPDAGMQPATLLENADKAMYLAKQEGGGHFKFAAVV